MLQLFCVFLFFPCIFAQCTTELCDCALTESCDSSGHDTKATLNNLYDLIINIKNENNIQQDDINKQNGDVSILKDNDQFLNATLQEQLDLVQQLETKISNLENENNIQQEDLDRQNEDISNLKDNGDFLNTTLQKQIENVVELDQTNRAQDTKIENLQGVINDLTSRINALETKNGDLTQGINSLSSRMNAVEATNRNLETRVNTLDGIAKEPLRGPIRLKNGPSDSEGRVEVYHGGQWGTVCDDNFDHDDAKVVCRQLGLGTKTTVRGDAYYGQGSGPIWMDNVDCVGSEDFIQMCGHNGWEIHNCGHSEDVGVRCCSGLFC